MCLTPSATFAQLAMRWSSICCVSSPVRGTWPLVEAAPIAQGGAAIVRWKRNLNLGVNHCGFCRVPIARANWPEGEQSAEGEPQQAPLSQVVIMAQVQGRQRHGGAIPASRRPHSFVQVVVGYCQAPTYCLCRSYSHRPKRRARRPSPEWVGIGRILDAMDRNLIKINAEPE